MTTTAPCRGQPIRLSNSALIAHAQSGVSLPVDFPDYDRSSLRPSIVHIGVGNFHRAHLAAYVDDLCRAGHTEWGIVGAGTLAGDARMAAVLAEQDHLFTLTTRDAQRVDTRVIGSMVEYVHAHPDPATLISRIADSRTQIVSLTITEGGYPVDDATGQYRGDSAAAGAGSAFALLAEGLDARRRAGGPPLTVMSCDNILSNGRVAKRSTMGEAARLPASELLAWIEDSVSFPNSMVDRITPATTPHLLEWLKQRVGLEDAWPVVAEPFRQWVIEDNFAGDRLPLEELDTVLVTNDVGPYELMKLRLLNAGHSCLAYPAALKGIKEVHTAMQDSQLRSLVRRILTNEAAPVLPLVPDIHIGSYIDSLLHRFSNPQVGDQIGRLCQDGSAKFPKFLLPTIGAQLAVCGPIEDSVFALASWCDYLAQSTGDCPAIEASYDSRLAEAQAYAARSVENQELFLEFAAVFPEELKTDRRFVKLFVAALTAIRGKATSAILAERMEA